MLVFGVLVYFDIKSKMKANEKLKRTNAALTDQKSKLSDALTNLKKSETKYRNLVENSPTGILYIDAKGNVIEVNKQLLKILGSPGEEETNIINCQLCGQMIPKDLWVANLDGERKVFCSPECEEIYLQYWLPKYKPSQASE